MTKKYTKDEYFGTWEQVSKMFEDEPEGVVTTDQLKSIFLAHQIPEEFIENYWTDMFDFWNSKKAQDIDSGVIHQFMYDIFNCAKEYGLIEDE